MQGKRIENTDGHIPENGTYWKLNDRWYCKTPNGHIGNLGNHDIVEHEDGAITVSPSILVSTEYDGKYRQLWHGYLEKGIWREC